MNVTVTDSESSARVLAQNHRAEEHRSRKRTKERARRKKESPNGCDHESLSGHTPKFMKTGLYVETSSDFGWQIKSPKIATRIQWAVTYLFVYLLPITYYLFLLPITYYHPLLHTIPRLVSFLLITAITTVSIVSTLGTTLFS